MAPILRAIAYTLTATALFLLCAYSSILLLCAAINALCPCKG